MKKIIIKTEAPHSNTQVLAQGNTQNPTKILILIHGRFGSAANILSLAEELSLDSHTLAVAPEAHGGQWYPHRFLEPRDSNEPHLSSALSVIGDLIDHCKKQYGIGNKDIVIAGFSQGACLVADYITHHSTRFAGVAIFSGGLIGTDKEVVSVIPSGNLKSTPVYIGSDERDPHIPKERVMITSSMLRKLGGKVDEKIYTGLGHSIHPDGIDFLSNALQQL